MKLLSWLQEPHESTENQNSNEPSLSPLLRARLEELREVPLKNLMVPRALITALDADVQLRRVRRLKSAKVTHFPVYRGDLDQILGWIPKSRVLELLNLVPEDVRLSDHLRPVGVVQENIKIDRLADEFLRSQSPVLVVVNPAGATVGIVPLAAFVELVFGFDLGHSTQSVPAELAVRSYEL